MARPAPSPSYTLRGAGGALNTLHFRCRADDPPLLISGSGKGAVHIWNLNTRRAEKVLDGHGGNSVIWVSTLQTAENLISQARDMRLCVWDVSGGRSQVVDSLWTGSVSFCQAATLQSSAGGFLLAFPGEQMEEIRIVELPSKSPVCTLVHDAKVGMVMCIDLWQPAAGPGPLLLAGYEDGSLLLWDVTQRSVLSRVKAHPEPIMCLTFDPSRLRGVSGSSEKRLCCWTLDGQDSLQVREQVALVNPGVSQLCLRPDGKLLASAGWDHRVRLFGWKKLRPLAVLHYHSDVVQSVAFSDHQDPRQRLLAAGSKDQRISLWSVYSEGV